MLTALGDRILACLYFVAVASVSDHITNPASPPAITMLTRRRASRKSRVMQETAHESERHIFPYIRLRLLPPPDQT